MKISLKKNNVLKEVPFGFSWTNLFFGFFVPLLRGDLKWAIIMIVVALLSYGFSWIIFPFFYNKIYIKSLLENGWVPANENDKAILVKAKMLVK